jgi:hypothetical protein
MVKFLSILFATLKHIQKYKKTKKHILHMKTQRKEVKVKKMITSLFIFSL